MKACISKASRTKIENKKIELSTCEFVYQQKLAGLLLKLRANTLDETEFFQQISLDEIIHSYEEYYVLKDKINIF